jgi:hypothetical protein
VRLVVDPAEGEQVVAEVLPLRVSEILKQHVVRLEYADDGLMGRDAALPRQALELVVEPALERSERFAERLHVHEERAVDERPSDGLAQDRIELRPRAADVGLDDASGRVDREA